MRLPAASSIVLTALLCSGFGGLQREVRAQDPSRDLPAERVPGITKDDALRLGLLRLRAGWNWEAARMFRELHVLDEEQPIPHLLLALSMRDVPNRAARHCYDAMALRENGTAAEQRLLDAYRAYFGVTDQPELTDERFQKVPGDKSRKQLIASLGALDANGSDGQLAVALKALETDALRATSRDDGDRLQLALPAHHGYLREAGMMPFMVPGYAQLFEDSRVFHSPAFDSDEHDAELRKKTMALLPRHPHHVLKRPPVPMLPGLKLKGSATTEMMWRPRKAKPFALPRGVGGTSNFSDYQGKPVLVVFFLGFGCAHCVAQLGDLDPKTPMFREAGIEVVTIGTDDLNAVKAARQAADENGVDPLHFDVLCDPKGDVFKQWGVWDEFSDEALHGTFLVDGKGRILWQDISLRPFEESDWLLAESKRLLAAWSAWLD